MTDANDEFRALMQRLREGSDEAAWQLVEQYGEPIRRAVRRALSARLRPQFDSLDFVQLVWSSFFAPAATWSGSTARRTWPPFWWR